MANGIYKRQKKYKGSPWGKRTSEAELILEYLKNKNIK